MEQVLSVQCYRTEKKNIGPSGGSPSQWVHYDKIHEILGRFPSNNQNLIEESFKGSIFPSFSPLNNFNV